MSVNGTLVEAKMSIFTLESTHFIFNKCSIYTHDDGARAKFFTNSQETDYSVALLGCGSATVYVVINLSRLPFAMNAPGSIPDPVTSWDSSLNYNDVKMAESYSAEKFTSTNINKKRKKKKKKR